MHHDIRSSFVSCIWESDVIPGIQISTMVVIWFRRRGGLGDDEMGVFILVVDRDEKIDIFNVCVNANGNRGGGLRGQDKVNMYRAHCYSRVSPKRQSTNGLLLISAWPVLDLLR